MDRAAGRLTRLCAACLRGRHATVHDAQHRRRRQSESHRPSPLWQELLTYADRHFLLGYGYEGFWTTATIDDVSNHQHWQIDSAHSSYIESLLTLGIVGVTLHTLALLAGLIEGIRLYRRTRRLLFLLAAALCAVYLLGGTLEAILLIKPSPISFYVALLLALLCLPTSAKRLALS